MTTIFPGMNPYLEGPLWTSFHVLFVPEIIRLLNPQLRPRYLALPQQYQLMSGGEGIVISPGQMFPDVGVVKINRPEEHAISVGVLSPPLEMKLAMPFPVIHPYIEIRDQEKRDLVTVIEFLSPANKRSPGRKKYQRKREAVLHSATHLLEIDLLHLGKRIPVESPLPRCPYFVFLSRVEKRPMGEFWPIRLDQALPRVPVPLAQPDPDVVLDLQAAFAAAYGLGGFEDLMDYRADPPLHLPADESAWMDGVLRAAGKRG